jgi:hypothetical protein
MSLRQRRQVRVGQFWGDQIGLPMSRYVCLRAMSERYWGGSGFETVRPTYRGA